MAKKQTSSTTESTITPEPHTDVPVVKKQFELSEDDLATLARGGYSDAAWEIIGRKHRIDPTTKEQVGRTAYVAVPKTWPKIEAKGGVPITTANFTNQHGAIHAGENMAAVRATLLSRDLTKPVSEETHEEEV